jgi:hypothetical protein
MPRTFTADSPLEALVLEHALALARQAQQAADAAPDGRVMSAVEGAVIPAARELARKAVEAALQTQAHEAEKRGHRAAPARPATAPRGPSDAPPGTS